MNLIILFENDRIDNGMFCLSDNRFIHIKDILKKESGEQLIVGMLNGPDGTTIIEQIDEDKIILSEPIWNSEKQEYNQIDLICALPRPQILKKVLFISGMMGIKRLFLIRANRVEKSYFHSPLLKQVNYQRFLIEGMSQGKNTFMPVISIHDKFKPFMVSFNEKYLEDENTTQKLLPHQDSNRVISDLYDKNSSSHIIAIGPEGGWVPFEIELMESIGFEKFQLSSKTLRVEHALTATLSQIELIKNQT
jgi:RsmE family RNA methyltransferase